MVKVTVDEIKDIKAHDNCPECNARWKGEDIFKHFMDAKTNPNHEQYAYYKDRSDAEILKVAGDYGWTPETPKSFGNIIGVELSYDDPERYDGVSYWMCPNCRVAWNRFNGSRSERFKSITNE